MRIGHNTMYRNRQDAAQLTGAHHIDTPIQIHCAIVGIH